MSLVAVGASEAARCLLDRRFRASTERSRVRMKTILGRRGALDCGYRFLGAKRLSAAGELADGPLVVRSRRLVSDAARWRSRRRSRGPAFRALRGKQANGDDINVHAQKQGTLRFPVMIVATLFAVRLWTVGR